MAQQQVGPQLAALPQREPARPVLAPLAPGPLVPVWARVRSVLAPQQVLVRAPPARACSGPVLVVRPPLALAQQRPTPRWRHMALARRRAWVAAC